MALERAKCIVRGCCTTVCVYEATTRVYCVRCGFCYDQYCLETAFAGDHHYLCTHSFIKLKCSEGMILETGSRLCAPYKRALCQVFDLCLALMIHMLEWARYKLISFV